MPPNMNKTPRVRPTPMPIDAFLEIPEWTAVDEVVEDKVGDVVLLRKASMLANSKWDNGREDFD